MDLNIVRTLVKLNNKSRWKEVRGSSTAIKAYHQQYESLILKNDVLYRHVESTGGQDVVDQLLLRTEGRIRALKEEFLDMVHGGVAGHLGSFKTRAHVG